MKRPPILYANSRIKAYGHREYCLLFEQTLSYIDIVTSNAKQMAARINRWSKEDGLAIRTENKGPVVRVFRIIRPYTIGKSRIVKLKHREILGLQYLKPGESTTFGPFFNTPVLLDEWKVYLQNATKELKKGEFTFEERISEHPKYKYHYRLVYIITRTL